MGRTTQSPELYISTLSPHWKCNLILYTSQACLARLPGPVPIQYSTPHTLPSAVTSETWKMSSPYSNLSTEVQTAITELESDSSTYKPQNANELLKIVDSVQIFFVTGDGHVSTFSAPETLRIFKFQEDQEDSTTSFLQVGGWTHPLIPGASIVKGAELLAQGIEVGAEKAGELIEYVTEKSQEKLTKAEEDAKVGKVVI